MPSKRMPVLSMYVQMLSVPGAVPDFICCIACVTSCSVGTPVYLYIYIYIVIWCVCVGDGVISSYGSRFSVPNFSKVPAHLLAWVASVVRGFPSLLLTLLALA